MKRGMYLGCEMISWENKKHIRCQVWFLVILEREQMNKGTDELLELTPASIDHGKTV